MSGKLSLFPPLCCIFSWGCWAHDSCPPSATVSAWAQPAGPTVPSLGSWEGESSFRVCGPFQDLSAPDFLRRPPGMSPAETLMRRQCLAQVPVYFLIRFPSCTNLLYPFDKWAARFQKESNVLSWHISMCGHMSPVESHLPRRPNS